MSIPTEGEPAPCSGGGGAVFGFSSEGEGVKRGQSTTYKGTALPNSGPPGTSLNLLIRMQEDRSIKGAVQSLETTFHPLSFEAHKPISSDTTLSRKKTQKTQQQKKPRYFGRAHYILLPCKKPSWKVGERETIRYGFTWNRMWSTLVFVSWQQGSSEL